MKRTYPSTFVAALSAGLSAGLAAGLLALSAGQALAQNVVRGEKIAAEGESPSWANGGTILSLNTAFTNPVGEVGFSGNMNFSTGSTNFVYRGDGTAFFNNSVLTNVLTGTESTMGIGSGGSFVYSPSIDGEDGIWSSDGYIVSSGDAVAAVPGKFFSFASRPTMFGDNKFAFVAGFADTPTGSTNTRALMRGELGTPGLTLEYKTGDVISNETLRFATPNMSFLYDYSDNGEHRIHIIGTGTGVSGINKVLLNDQWIVEPGIQVEGTIYPNEAWATFAGVSVDNFMQYFVWGTVSNFDNGAASYILNFNGENSIHRSDTIDGVTLTNGTVRVASLNNNAYGAHIWSYGSGSPTPKVLFAGNSYDLANNRVVVKTNDLVDLDNDGVGDFRVHDMPETVTVSAGMDLADDNSVVTRLTLEPIGGGTRFDAIVKFCYVDCPPVCPRCAADFNEDGGVDGGDVESFFSAWSAGETCGDTNLDGGTDGGDVEAFFLVWSAGGC
jgi:hypothetical protein